MRCLVPVKRVVDFNVKIRVKSDGSGVETDHVKMSLNPFDEIALEEAVRKKEMGQISEILAVTIGRKDAEESLRTALARGADRALLIETDTGFEPVNIAKILKVLVKQEKIDFVILGKQAIDDDCNQTGQMLAGLLGWGQGTNAYKLELDTSKKICEVVREVDGGLETLQLKLPAVVTVDLRLNEPRYISLPNVMKAKSKPLVIKKLTELKTEFKAEIKNETNAESNFETTQHLKVLKVEAPEARKAGVKVGSVQELVDKLRNEAKVI